MATTQQPQVDFVKAITRLDATALVVGSMIGSGIFIVAAEILREVHAPGLLLVVWAASGVVTLMGALTYGELAAMFPRAGGQYVYLREGISPLFGYLYGWTLFVVIQTGTIAAVAVAFGRFLGVVWPAVTPGRYAWFPQWDVTTPGSRRCSGQASHPTSSSAGPCTCRSRSGTSRSVSRPNASSPCCRWSCSPGSICAVCAPPP
jgi:amino acid transporter